MKESIKYYIMVCRNFFAARPVRVVITCILFVTFFVLNISTTTDILPLTPHFLYSFSHANIFHLLGNLLCLFLLKGKLHLIHAYLVAVAASFIPVPHFPFPDILPVCGFSAFLFAEVGIRFGKLSMLKEMTKATLPFFIISLFIPYLATAIHVYALLLGYAVGLTLKQKLCANKK